MNKLDGEKSKKNKDAGIRQVSRSNLNWLIAVHERLRKISKEREGQMVTGEDVRSTLMEFGLEPNHPNAWGALINGLIKKKVLIRTNSYRSMKDPRSHARSTRVYKLAGWQE
jgi:hypothetical protein